MAAKTIFNDLLKSIEDSNLNYVMSKTPFSAAISIKSSFIKRFGSVESDVKNFDKVKKEQNADDLEGKLAIIEDENLKLKEKLLNSEQVSKSQKVWIDNLKKDMDVKERFEDLYVDTKDKLVESEKQIANLRSDLLKVKAEKKDLGVKCKVLVEKNEHLAADINQIKHENETMEKQKTIMSDKILKFEKEKLDTEKYKATIEQLELQMHLKNIEEKEKSCKFCECKTNNEDNLADHTRTKHYEDKESQYQETFEEYHCFYCNF